MLKSTQSVTALIVLLTASLACSMTFSSAPAPVPTLDPQHINTLIAQTIAVVQTQSAQPGASAGIVDTVTPSPTLSPTPTLTLTPAFTFTPPLPFISVDIDTNCRVGPGKAYERVGALLAGETAEVYGRNPTGGYWYIRNPDNNESFCWVWGAYATVTGNPQDVPMITPPPTPTPAPSFDVAYMGTETCNNKWWVEFKIDNTGGMAFRSVSMTVLDMVTNASPSMTNDEFVNVDGCISSASRNSLAPGGTMIISSPSFAYDPGGHKLHATITFCSADGVNGMCATKEINFTP